MKKTVGIIFGGKSNEHEVSLLSANSVFQNVNYDLFNVVPIMITTEGIWVEHETLTSPTSSLNDLRAVNPGQEGEIDIYFSVVHGDTGEDGKLQGYLEMNEKRYIGCGVEASVLSMNKILAKEIAKNFGDVPVVPYSIIRKNEWNLNALVEPDFDYPVFVKPARAGSSVGITKAYNKKDYNLALAVAFEIDDSVLVERFIKGKEIEVGVIGVNSIESSRVGEISFSSDFYDYENKYLTDNATMHIPARIEQHFQEKTKRYAEKIFSVLGCKGYSRVDFFLEDETNDIYFNEINTSPGMTEKSMFPVLFGDKYTFTELLTKIINEN